MAIPASWKSADTPHCAIRLHRRKVAHGFSLSILGSKCLSCGVFPISDENPTRRFPILTILLIAANVAVFFVWQVRSGLEYSVQVAGLVPTQLSHFSISGVTHVFTSMFMHGSLFHLLGNMWFLWIFGDNVEDEFGRIQFLIFYLLSGVAGAVTQVVVHAQSIVPMVGASAAISGVLGAYLVLHPRARVNMLFWIRVIQLPAWFYLFVWIGLQILSQTQSHETSGTGVAYFAHIGGFVMGILLAIVLPRRDTVES
jgi:membrane associated rhomboid family serine protease